MLNIITLAFMIDKMLIERSTNYKHESIHFVGPATFPSSCYINFHQVSIPFLLVLEVYYKSPNVCPV